MIRVYDDRTNETLFESEESLECVAYIELNYDENDDDFSHIWIEEVLPKAIETTESHSVAVAVKGY